MQAQPMPDVTDDTEEHVEDSSDTGISQPVFTFPAPGDGTNPNNPVFVPIPNGGAGQPGTTPVITLQPNPNGQPTIYNLVPNPDGAAAPPPPTTGFGAIGAPTPGMIQQPPPPAAGQRPPPPPGR
jgi:hypothetical protein